MAVSNLGGERTKSGPQAAVNVLIWVVAVIILAFLTFSIFKPKGAVVDDLTPEALIRSYTEFVAVYRPPSTTSPSVANVEAFFKYFDNSSADFFDENFEKMAWVRYQGNPAPVKTWEEMSKGEKQAEAVKYLTTVGALRGGSIQSKREEGGVLKINMLSAGNTFEVELIKTSTGWRFADLLGQTATINRQLGNIELPKQGN